MDDISNIIQTISIWALPVLLAITVHEVAHGRTALYFGDTTAASQGRLSLNPLRHIDPIGTVLVPLLLIALQTGFIFGWAKPVPVNAFRLRSPKRDMALVALAGPASNVVMGIGWALLLSLALALESSTHFVALPLYYMAIAGITINVFLTVLNMLPVPPLDGAKVLAGLLPDRLAMLLWRMEPFGFIILLLLIASGILIQILGPPAQFLQGFIVDNFVFRL